MTLSDAKCRAEKAGAKQKKLSDGGGLYLLVLPSAGKSWRMAYRFDGKQKVVAFGPYPAIGLADARDKREAAKKLLAAGVDPAAQRKAATAPESFAGFARRWHDTRKSEWVPEHAARVWSRIERDVLPEIGGKTLNQIEAPDVLALLRKVEERGALDIARRLKQSVGSIFRFAIAEGKARHNPAADVGEALKPRPKTRHFASFKAHEIPEFLQRLATYDGEHQTRLAVEFTLHTFVRTNETRFAAWAEFEELDGPAPLWRIPPHRMKMEREHLVPLSPPVVGLLREIRQLSGDSRYLFPGDGKAGVTSQNTMIFALYRLGYHSKATIHGFRGTASTVLNEQGFNSDHIERQLAHVEENEIRGAYNSAEWLPARRQMMIWWSNYLDTAVRQQAA